MKPSGPPSFSKVCVLALMLVSYTDAYIVAAPRAPRVVSGNASFQQDGNLTTINASNRSIINYQSFDIGANETVRFVQPGPTSTVLNRVISVNPTNIFGSLQSNGIVYVVNPYGVYFQNGSVLNVGGLVAAAGHINNADFTAGRIHFTDLTGDVRNDGVLAADNRIALMGANVANTGTVTVARGVAMMTSGNDIYVGEKGGNIYVQANGAAVASAQAGSVTNSGKVAAPRVVLGAGDMYSTAIVNSGLLQGRSVAVNAGRNGTVTVGGRVDASAPTARVNGGKGGDIQVTGGTVALKGAALDASGVNGGGSVRVGGDFHGGSTVAHANTTTVDAATTINADATGKTGDGGTVVVWSDTTTTFGGQISARGVNGGSVEVSSKQDLSYLGQTDLRAAGSGKTGSLLLDPQNIVIATGGTDTIPAGGTVPFDDGAATRTISPTTLQNALGQANVTLQATTDIRFSNNVSVTTGTSMLTLQAGRSILFDGGITLSIQGKLVATFNDHNAQTLPNGTPGRADNTAGTFTMSPNSAITARGGVSITGDTYAGVAAGLVTLQNISTASATAGTASGAISVTNTNNGGNGITSSGTLTTTPTAANTNGANITLSGNGTINVNGLSAAGSGTGTGGLVTLSNTGSNTNLNAALNGAYSFLTTGGALVTVAQPIGNTTALNSIFLTGSSNLNSGTVNTTGAQTYNGTVTLGADTTLSSAGGTISLATVTGPSRALTLSTSGQMQLLGGANLASLTTGSGTLNLYGTGGTTVTTSGNQTYNGPVVLNLDTTLTSTAGNISFASTVGSDALATPRSLTLNAGTTAFGGNVGVVPLRSLTVNGTTRFTVPTSSTSTPTVTTINNGAAGAGNQTYNGNVQLGTDTYLTSNFASGQTNAGSIAFNGTVTNFPAGSARSLFLVAGAGQFVVPAAANLHVNGFDLDGALVTFAQPVGAAGDNLNLLQITANGASTITRSIRLGDTYSTSAGQVYRAPVVLTANTVLSDTTGKDITFQSTVDSDGTPRSLSLSTAGAMTFSGAVGGTVGGTTQLLSLTTGGGGTTEINGGSVVTTGLQTYGNAVTISGDTVLTSLNTAGDAGAITFSSTLDGNVANDFHFLTINTPGDEVFGDRVGGTNPLRGLAIDAAGTVGGTARFNMTLAAPAAGSLTAGVTVGSGGIAIADSTRFNITGSNDNTTPAVLAFNGGTQAYSTGSAANTQAANAAFQTTLAQNTVLIGTDATTAPTAPAYTNGGSVTFGASYSLPAGGTYTVGPVVGINSPNLTIYTSRGPESYHGTTSVNRLLSGGAYVTFWNSVSGINTLQTVANPGFGSGPLPPRDINADITTVNEQTYDGPTVLSQDVILTSGGSVTFGGTLDSDSAGPWRLTINTPAQTIFNGRVGSLGALRSLTTDYQGGVGEATQINGGGVITTGFQTYNDPVLLGADAALLSTNDGTVAGAGFITFTRTLDGAHNLDVSSRTNQVFNGRVGGNTPLLSLTTDGNSAYRGGGTIFNFAGTTAAPTVTTRNDTTTATLNNGLVVGLGAQTYNDAVVLQANTVLTSTFVNPATAGGNVTFNSTVDSAFDLTTGPVTRYSLEVNTSGNEVFRGNVGTSDLNGNSALLSLTTDADAANRGGATNFGQYGDTGTLTVATRNNGMTGGGAQTFNDAVVLNVNATLTSGFDAGQTVGGNVTFNSLVDSTLATVLVPNPAFHSLTINTGALTTFNANALVGSRSPLAALTTDAGGQTQFLMTIPAPTGTAPVAGVRVGGDVTIGDIAFFNTTGSTTGSNYESNPTVLTFNNGKQSYLDLAAVRTGTTLIGISSPNAPAALGYSGDTANTGGAAIRFAARVTSGAGSNLTIYTGTGFTTFENSVTVGAVELQGANVTFQDTVSGLGTLFVGRNDTVVNGIDLNGGLVRTNAGIALVTGDQYYRDPVYLTANADLQDVANSNIYFASTVNSYLNQYSLRLNTTRDEYFLGVVGGQLALSSLTVDDANNASPSPALTTIGTTRFLMDASGGAGVNVTGNVAIFDRVQFGVTGSSVVDPSRPSVRTGGAQTYYSPATLTQDTSLYSSGSGDITFFNKAGAGNPGSTVDGAFALSVFTGGQKIFNGYVGSNTPLASLTTDGRGVIGSGTQLNAGTGSATGRTVTTTGFQIYGDAVSLGDDAVLKSTNPADITFKATIDSDAQATPRNLTVNTLANEFFNGSVGAANPLASLVTDADAPANNPNRGTAYFGLAGAPITVNTINTGAANATGAQTYNDAVVLNADVTFNSRGANANLLGGNLTFNQMVNGTVNATFNTTADEFFEGLVGNTAPLLSLTTDAAGGVGGTAHFDMDAGSQAAGIAGVRVGGGGVLINDAVVFNVANATPANPSVLVYGNGTQTYNGNALVARNTFLVGSDSATPPTTPDYTGGGAVLFAGTVTGSVPPTPNLTIYTGAGRETYKGFVNVNTLLSGGAAVTFLGNVSGPNRTFSGINTLQTVANPTTGSGGAPVTPGPIDINNDITTVNGQTYGPVVVNAQNPPVSVVLSQNVTLTAGGDVRFSGTVDSEGTTPYSLTVNTPRQTIFGGFVGGIHPLLSLTTDFQGGTFGPNEATQINGGGVITTGFQTYNDPVLLGANATLQSLHTAPDTGFITFARTLDSDSSATPRSLTVTTPTDEYFEGLVGNAAPLLNLTTDVGITPAGGTHFDMPVGIAVAGVNVSDYVTINDSVFFNAAISSPGHPTVLTGGAQTYQSVTAGAGQAILSQTTYLQSTGGGNITFNRTLDGAFALTLNTVGDEFFNGLVGSSSALASLTVDDLYNGTNAALTTIGTTRFLMDAGGPAGVNVSGDVTVRDRVEFGVKGSRVVDNTLPSVLTGGNQYYYGAATLSQDTALRSTGASQVHLFSTVDGARALAVFTAGVTTFGSPVGGTVPLTSVATDATGTTAINGGVVNTTGFQTYGDAVRLGADAVLFSSNTAGDGGNITFQQTLDSDGAASPRSLQVNTPGSELFNGRVGGVFALRSLETDANAGFRGGQTVFNVAAAPTVTTTDFQTYNDAVLLSQNTSLTSTAGGTLTFNNIVDGPGALTLSTAGAMTFNKVVGGTTPLANLVAGGGPIFLNGGAITTVNFQTYNGAATLGVDTTLTSNNSGEVRFAFTLDGKRNLTINTGGDEVFLGLVGSNAALLSLRTDVAGTVGGAARFGMDGTGAAAGVTVSGNVAILDNTVFAMTQAGDTVPTIVTGGSQAYQGTVTAGSQGATRLKATGNVLFLNDVNVTSDLLRVDAQRIVAHNIRGSGAGTHSLDLESVGLLLLAGNEYDLGGGKISLNTDLRINRPLGNPQDDGKATIVLKPADNNSTVTFTADNFEMGYRQTMLDFGSVAVRATSSATLSTVEASGNLTVASPSITLLSRPLTLRFNNRQFGLLYVAGGQIDFGGGNIRFVSTRPGDVAQAAFFTTSGGATIQRVTGTSLFSDPGLIGRFTGIAGVAGYDQVARQTSLGLDGTNIPVSNQLSDLPPLSLTSLQGNQSLDVAAALAGALPLVNQAGDLGLPSEGLAITAAQMDQLKKLGINPRLAERNERSSIRDKRALFAQLVNAGDTENYGRLQPIKGAVSRLVPSDFVVVVDRMSAAEVQSILQAFEEVRGKDDSKATAAKAKVEAAYVDFATNSSNAADGKAFADYVRKNPAKYGDLNGTARDFDNLFGRLEGLGLTDAEVARSEEHIVHDIIQPAGLTETETRRFVNELRKGLPADQRAPSNSAPPSAPVGAPEKKKATPPPPRTARQHRTDAPSRQQAIRAPAPTPDAARAVAGL